MKVKEESEKADLKLSIQKMKIMASGPITSWQIDGETMEKMTHFLQIVTVAMQLKDTAPWKKSYDQPREHIKKQRHYFAYKVRLVKAMVFPVVLYECESWTIKKAEDYKETWCFRIVVLRRLLWVPWTAWKSNQSILKKIKPENSLEGLMLKLKPPLWLWPFWPPDAKSWLIGKDPDSWKD